MCTEAVGAENPKRSLFVKSDGRFNWKEGLFTDELHELLVNAPYGGELRIYFNAIFSRLITGDTSHDFKRIRFYGGVIVAIVDSRNGAGYHVSLQTDITLPFYRDNLLWILRYIIPMRMKFAGC